MFNGTASNGAGGQFTETRGLTVPNVPNGTYWILWQIDTGNSVNEYNESDNAVHSATNFSAFVEPNLRPYALVRASDGNSRLAFASCGPTGHVQWLVSGDS
jgi:hypothetical protein